MSDLSADAKALIERSRLQDAPSGDDKERIRSRLSAQLGAGAFAGAAIASTMASSAGNAVGEGASAVHGAGAIAKAALVKWIAGALAAAAVVGGAVVAWPEDAPDTTVKNVAPTAPVPEPAVRAPVVVDKPAPVQPEPTTTAAREAEPAPPKRARKRAKAPAFEAIGSTPSMSAEIALLARAQSALRARDGEQALRLARQHAENFPTGALYEERLGIEAIAHCLRGERDHASVRTFLARAPQSPLAARVRKECKP